MRRDIGIAQDVVLQLQIVQPMSDDVADADDAGELSVAQNRHMAHPMTGHQAHHVGNGFGRGNGDHAASHDLAHGYRCHGLAIARNRMNDFTFGNETENCVAARYHEGADIFCMQPVRRSLDADVRGYCCDVGALSSESFDGHSILRSVCWRPLLPSIAGLCRSVPCPQHIEILGDPSAGFRYRTGTYRCCDPTGFAAIDFTSASAFETLSRLHSLKLMPVTIPPAALNAASSTFSQSKWCKRPSPF